MTSPPEENNKILLVDDNSFNRDGMKLYLSNHGFTVLEAGDQAEAYALAAAERPWVSVVDIVIPTTAGAMADINHSVGVELARQLKELDPAMGIVLFSAHEDRGGLVWDQVRDGVRGIAYLLKGVRPERVLEAIHRTAAGAVILDGIAPTNRRRLGEEILDRLSDEERPWVIRAVILIPQLSPQEYRIGLRIAASQTNQGIGSTFGIAIKTVENHISKIYKKLALSDVDDLAPHLRKAALLAKAFMVYELQTPDDGSET